MTMTTNTTPAAEAKPQPARYRVVLTYEVDSRAAALALQEQAQQAGGRVAAEPVYLMRWELDDDNEPGETYGSWRCGRCGSSDVQLVGSAKHWWQKDEQAADTPKRITFVGGFDYGDGVRDEHVRCGCGARNELPEGVKRRMT